MSHEFGVSGTIGAKCIDITYWVAVMAAVTTLPVDGISGMNGTSG